MALLCKNAATMIDISAHQFQHLSDLFIFHDHPEALEAITPFIRNKNFGKDVAVLHHGDEAKGLWLVLKGWIKLTRQTPDGKETITGLCTEGDIFGEACLFPHANYPYNADSIASDSELAFIPAEAIRGIIKSNPVFSSAIMAMLNERVSKTQLMLEHMSTMTTAQRLGCFFLRLCNKHAKANQATLLIPIEKYLLASYLGMKPETLSRSQALLKSVGVSVAGSQVELADITKLREFVCNSCSESGTCETDE